MFEHLSRAMNSAQRVQGTLKGATDEIGQILAVVVRIPNSLERDVIIERLTNLGGHLDTVMKEME